MQLSHSSQATILRKASKWLAAQRDQDEARMHALLDDLYWHTANAEQSTLVEVAEVLMSGKYIDLPLPLQTIIFRLAGMESPVDFPEVQVSISNMGEFCDNDIDELIANLPPSLREL